MITPALSVASAVLILSGVVYTLIGIKNKRHVLPFKLSSKLD